MGVAESRASCSLRYAGRFGIPLGAGGRIMRQGAGEHGAASKESIYFRESSKEFKEMSNLVSATE